LEIGSSATGVDSSGEGLTVAEQESNSLANNAICNDDKGDNPLEIGSSATGVDSSGEGLTVAEQEGQQCHLQR